MITLLNTPRKIHDHISSLMLIVYVKSTIKAITNVFVFNIENLILFYVKWFILTYNLFEKMNY